MKKIIIFAVAIIIGVGAFAQGQQGGRRGAGQFSPERFKQKMTGFITAEADFTQSEANAFFPIFSEFKDKQRDIMQKIMRLKQPKGEEQNVNYEQRVLQIAALDKEAATLETTYYKKLCKTVPAKKVYKALIAEDRFHRQMLEKFNQNPDPRGPKGPNLNSRGQRQHNDR